MRTNLSPLKFKPHPRPYPGYQAPTCERPSLVRHHQLTLPYAPRAGGVVHQTPRVFQRLQLAHSPDRHHRIAPAGLASLAPGFQINSGSPHVVCNSHIGRPFRAWLAMAFPIHGLSPMANNTSPSRAIIRPPAVINFANRPSAPCAGGTRSKTFM